MKSVVVGIFLLGLVFLSPAFAGVGNCDFWQPGERVKAFSVTHDQSKTLDLLAGEHYVKVQHMPTGELSIAMFESNTQDLVSVARGTEGLTMSQMNPRFLVSCFWSE